MICKFYFYTRCENLNIQNNLDLLSIRKLIGNVCHPLTWNFRLLDFILYDSMTVTLKANTLTNHVCVSTESSFIELSFFLSAFIHLYWIKLTASCWKAANFGLRYILNNISKERTLNTLIFWNFHAVIKWYSNDVLFCFVSILIHNSIALHIGDVNSCFERNLMGIWGICAIHIWFCSSAIYFHSHNWVTIINCGLVIDNNTNWMDFVLLKNKIIIWIFNVIFFNWYEKFNTIFLSFKYKLN